MADRSPHLYTVAGRAAGVSEAVLARASYRIARTQDSGAEPILSLRHLAHLTGASYSYLRRIVARERDPFVDIRRLKRDGRARPLAAPEPVLMDVQRFILRATLRSLPLHSAAFAYRHGHSIVDCARQHVGARYLVKFDLHDFFSMVSEKRAYRVFFDLGYSELVSFELARLCTRLQGTRWREVREHEQYAAIPQYAVPAMGYLPQGAPTSGAIANSVATPLDRSLNELARSMQLVYTRYSDDLVFSSSHSFTRRDVPSLVARVSTITARHGFPLHRRKTRVVPPGARRIVLGLLVDEDRVRLLPEFRRRVEVHVRGVARFGLAEHAEHRGFNSIFSLVDHVNGLIAFAKDVEPSWAVDTREAWHRSLRDSAFPI